MFTRFRLFLSPDAEEGGISDIDSMLEDLLGEERDSPVEEPAGEAEEPAQEEAASSTESVEQPAGEGEGEEKPESEVAEVEVTPAAEEPVETLEQVNARLQKQLEEMANKLAEASQQKPVEVAPTEADKLREQKAADTKPAAEVKSFLSDDEYEEAFKSTEGMNKALNKVYQAATSEIIVRMANIVPQMVQSQVTINGLVADFYRANEDLVPHKPYVGYVTQQLASAHPDWDYSQLFKEVEKEVRKNLAKAKAQEKRTVAQTPKVPAPSGRVPAVPATRVSQIEKDMLDLLADDE